MQFFRVGDDPVDSSDLTINFRTHDELLLVGVLFFLLFFFLLPHGVFFLESVVESLAAVAAAAACWAIAFGLARTVVCGGSPFSFLDGRWTCRHPRTVFLNLEADSVYWSVLRPEPVGSWCCWLPGLGRSWRAQGSRP